MGQKSSKKVDIYATENATHCHLLPGDVSQYVGRAREYTAVDVYVEGPDNTADQNDEKKGDGKKKSPKKLHPNSVIKLLTRAHRKSYHLAFIIPKVEGGKSSRLGRDSFIKEENESEGNDATGEEVNQYSHTVFLFRPKVKSRLKKEFSLKRMEAKKTFLNIMMDVSYGWVFITKDFVKNVSKIPSGEYAKEVNDIISEQALKGGRLLTVMCVDDTAILRQATTENKQADRKLHLRMVFLHRNTENPKPVFQYSVKCVGIQCTEQTLKPNKKQDPGRDVNVTWSTDWMSLFQAQTKLTEVINVGELPTGEAPEPAKKGKKIKIRSFEVMTLCFYETFLPEHNKEKINEDDDELSDVFHDVAGGYEGLVREVWAPIDETVQENLESEAEKLGGHGWELSTVLVTSHVRNHAENQKQLQKCAIFFQRPEEKYISQDEREKSRENLLESDLGKIAIEESHPPETELLDDANIPPTSPKEKIEKYGMAMLPQVDLSQAKKLKTASPKREATKPQESPVITKVQLKKVNRDEIKKETAPQFDASAVTQFKLRPTETNRPVQPKNGEAPESVPWLATLDKKREAVMKVEPKTPEMARTNAGGDEITRKYDELQEKRNKKLNKEPKEIEIPVFAPDTADEKIEKPEEEVKTISTDTEENVVDFPPPPSVSTIEEIETVEVPSEIPDKEIEPQTEVSVHVTPIDLPSPISFDFTEIEQLLDIPNFPSPIDVQPVLQESETTGNKEDVTFVVEDTKTLEETENYAATSIQPAESIVVDAKLPEPSYEVQTISDEVEPKITAAVEVAATADAPITATVTNDGQVTEQPEDSNDDQHKTEEMESNYKDNQGNVNNTVDMAPPPSLTQNDDDSISKSFETSDEASEPLNDDLPTPPPTTTHFKRQDTFTSTFNTVLLSPKVSNPDLAQQRPPADNEISGMDLELPIPAADFPPPIQDSEETSFPDPQEDLPPPITKPEETIPVPNDAESEDLPPIIAETEEIVSPPLGDAPPCAAPSCAQPRVETPDVVPNGPVENQPEDQSDPEEEVPLRDQEPLSVLYLPSPPPITEDFYQDSPEGDSPPPADGAAETSEDHVGKDAES